VRARHKSPDKELSHTVLTLLEAVERRPWKRLAQRQMYVLVPCHLVGAECAERISDNPLQSAAGRGHGLQEGYGISRGPLEPHTSISEATSRKGWRDTARKNQLAAVKCTAFETVAIKCNSTALKGMTRVVRHSSSPIREMLQRPLVHDCLGKDV